MQLLVLFLIGLFNSITCFSALGLEGGEEPPHCSCRFGAPDNCDCSFRTTVADCQGQNICQWNTVPNSPLVQPRVRHVVMGQFSDGATDAQKEEMLEALRGLPEQIPEILRLACGLDLGISEGNHGWYSILFSSVGCGNHGWSSVLFRSVGCAAPTSTWWNAHACAHSQSQARACARKRALLHALQGPLRGLRGRGGVQKVRGASGAHGRDYQAYQAAPQAGLAHRRAVLPRPDPVVITTNVLLGGGVEVGSARRGGARRWRVGAGAGASGGLAACGRLAGGCMHIIWMCVSVYVHRRTTPNERVHVSRSRGGCVQASCASRMQPSAVGWSAGREGADVLKISVLPLLARV